MTRDEYWRECVAQAADECGAALSKEQINDIAEAVQGAAENIDLAYPIPASPLEGQIKRLETELKTEKSKFVCPKCNGSGRIISRGPHHSSDSGCLFCRGDGKVTPERLRR